MTEARELKKNDVLRHHLTSELYAVTDVADDTVTMKEVYGDKEMAVFKGVANSPTFQEVYIFCWNAVEEGWAGA